MIKNIDKINTSLEDKGWCLIENYFSSELCKQLLDKLSKELKQNNFKKAVITNVGSSDNNNLTRNSQILWINDWESDECLLHIYKKLNNIIVPINNYFRLSIKSFESQFALYNEGGFYKKHLDATNKNNRRILSSILYLNNCDNGGELNLYSKRSKDKVDRVIVPKIGSHVLFFSDQIYHEVEVTKKPRYSITTWFRNDIPILY